MKSPAVWTRTIIAIAAVVTASACRSDHDLRKPSGQAGFGVEMAKSNLWREAMFRFQRAVELDPQNAEAYNNLAVAYEANGDFENATKAYREAMRLDKSNQYIQKNYSRLVEFQSRNKKRQSKSPAAEPEAATASAPAAATATPATPATPSTPSIPPEQPAPESPATPEPPAPQNPAPAPPPEAPAPDAPAPQPPADSATRPAGGAL